MLRVHVSMLRVHVSMLRVRMICIISMKVRDLCDVYPEQTLLCRVVEGYNKKLEKGAMYDSEEIRCFISCAHAGAGGGKRGAFYVYAYKRRGFAS